MLSINQKINNYFAKFLTGLIKHKFIASIVLIVVIGSSYFGYTKIFNNNNAIRYVLVQAQKGALIVSVSGSGQVSATNQVDIKSKAGGDIACINVQDGQEIKVGALIAEIDSQDAQKTAQIKLHDNGSKIVFYSDSSKIDKFINGTSNDLEVGKTITVNGKINPDGSITAESIQLRP
ncbi:efflux RND transporter periplasmic adaptor subunit [Patescibacteria group bacterium]|nr:efflux RND transporter periplasmic adaptor subunit [Patescibacteria group bacterium]